MEAVSHAQMAFVHLVWSLKKVICQIPKITLTHGSWKEKLWWYLFYLQRRVASKELSQLSPHIETESVETETLAVKRGIGVWGHIEEGRVSPTGVLEHGQ